jgi:hypothetical protein
MSEANGRHAKWRRAGGDFSYGLNCRQTKIFLDRKKQDQDRAGNGKVTRVPGSASFAATVIQWAMITSWAGPKQEGNVLVCAALLGGFAGWTGRVQGKPLGDLPRRWTDLEISYI